MKKIIIPSILLIIALSCLPSCAPTVSQEEYDRVTNELTAAQNQIASLQGDLAEAKKLQATYNELSTNYEAVKSKLEIMQAKHDELSVKYDELSAEYDELSAKYDAVLEGTAGISEEDVEQAIFELINQERQNNGLNELEWSEGLYWWAMEHSQHMATTKRLEYSEHPYWQDIFRAAGYSTLDRIANAALIIWKESLQYERNFLNNNAKYGAVAASKSGEIFYIACFADVYRY